MSGEALVTVPERRLRDLEAQVVRATALAEEAAAIATQANDRSTALEAMLEGLRELLQGRIDGVLGAVETDDPIVEGFRAHRRRVLASEGRRD